MRSWMACAVLSAAMTWQGNAQGAEADKSAPLVPWPKSVTMGQGSLELKAGGRIVAADASLMPLAQVLSDEIYRVSGVRLKTDKGEPKAGDIALQVDRQTTNEAYTLTITDRAVVRGGNYRAVAWGTVTLVQAADGGASLPQMTVTDEPAAEYRALMIDCARQWHPAEVLKDIIAMCRLYKINYLHLHLTDSQLFTFPSKAFPTLPSMRGKDERRHYTWEELVDLVRFADERGVTLVPELETPGHSGAMCKIAPFGRPGVKCVNIADEKTYEAFDTLIGEICEVFKSSPFFHLGGDEVSMDGIGKSEEEQAYMKAHGLEKGDLYWHHLVRIDEIIKKHGKRSMFWGGGFHNDGNDNVKLPKDMIAYIWEIRGSGTASNINRTIINAAWKPLYVVSNKAALPQYILEKWNLRLWQHYNGSAGVQLPPNEPVFGAEMCAWEQPAEIEIPSIRWRLPAMSEKIYSPESGRSYADYARRFDRTDALLDILLCPVRVEFEGLVGDVHDRVFTDTLTIKLSARTPGTIRYTLDGSQPTNSSPAYAAPITVKVGEVKSELYLKWGSPGRTSQRLHLKVACFGADGQPVGNVREEILYATPPLVRAKIYYSPSMVAGNTNADWDTARDWEKMGVKPDKEVIWPSLVFSVDFGTREAVSVPACSGVLSKGRIKVPEDAKYAFLYADSGGEVYLDGELVSKRDTMPQATALKAGLHDIEVRYAHKGYFHHGKQSLLYAVLKEGQTVNDLLNPPRPEKKEILGRPKPKMWRDHAELLVPLSP